MHAIEHVDEGQGINASEIADGEYKDDAAQSQPSNPDRSHTSTIFDVAAFPLSFPTHEVTVRVPESCGLSNCDQIAEIFEFFGDESLGQERDTKTSCNIVGGNTRQRGERS